MGRHRAKRAVPVRLHLARSPGCIQAPEGVLRVRVFGPGKNFGGLKAAAWRSNKRAAAQGKQQGYVALKCVCISPALASKGFVPSVHSLSRCISVRCGMQLPQHRARLPLIIVRPASQSVLYAPCRMLISARSACTLPSRLARCPSLGLRLS